MTAANSSEYGGMVAVVLRARRVADGSGEAADGETIMKPLLHDDASLSSGDSASSPSNLSNLSGLAFDEESGR